MIADAHVDLLMELAYRERRLGETNVFAETWLPLLELGGVGTPGLPDLRRRHRPAGGIAARGALHGRRVPACAAREPRPARAGRDAADLDVVETGERLGLVLALEGVECFGVETWPADVFHALGVRMAGLTWNRRNAFADGAAEDGGSLSRLGRELVDRLVSLGVILDLAHASRGVFAEVLERLDGAPVLCSHGGCRGVFDTPRNLDDGQLRALAAAGGIFGLMLHPIAIGPERRTIDGAIDHLEHAASLIGVERICLGGDFTKRLWEAMPPPPEPKDGLAPPGVTPGLGIEGLSGPEGYPALVAALHARGWATEEVAAVTSGNLLRFLRASL